VRIGVITYTVKGVKDVGNVAFVPMRKATSALR
jgi:hypothetical protein